MYEQFNVRRKALAATEADKADAVALQELPPADDTALHDLQEEIQQQKKMTKDDRIGVCSRTIQDVRTTNQ